jgi:hypothetical protein
VEGATDCGLPDELGDPPVLPDVVPTDPPPPQALNSPVVDNTLTKSKPIRLECFIDFPCILIFKTVLSGTCRTLRFVKYACRLVCVALTTQSL